MLKIKFKDGRVDPIALEPPGKTIGKGGANDIVIENGDVAGFHADLKVEGSHVTISDINTKSGTFVNGDKIVSSIPLRAGDTIIIGGTELELFEEEEGEGKTLVLSGTALMEMGVGSWSLIAQSGPEKGQVIPIMDRIEIGRALECDISILEPGLSRKHAELELNGDYLILRDLGSVNGTFVNGEKVDEVKLKDGDKLQFERIRFNVSSPE